MAPIDRLQLWRLVMGCNDPELWKSLERKAPRCHHGRAMSQIIWIRCEHALERFPGELEGCRLSDIHRELCGLIGIIPIEPGERSNAGY